MRKSDKKVQPSNVNFSLVKTAEEIKLIERACRIVAETLGLLEKYVKPGVETIELDKIAEDYILSHDALPAFKGYRVENKEYPFTLCISIDDEVVHGLPRQKFELHEKYRKPCYHQSQLRFRVPMHAG